MKTNFLEFAKDILIEAFFQTLYMTAVATIFATIIGFIIAITLVITDSNGLRPNKKLNDVLGGIINTVRSFPFIILMVAIIPLTRFIVGKAIGVNAALVPLTIGAAPFILIEAAKSFGASDFQIIFKVMIKEAMPSIVSGITLSTISILGYTAMAGAVGAGGLGAVALTYGYQKFDTSVMLYTVLILIVIVQLIQCIGNLAYKKLK
ncbi:MAG: ABC transporter permease [Peptostreptococcaceae bacterium]|nr:ABC transporter permease [Peptostreptococcaceae bacterium]